MENSAVITVSQKGDLPIPLEIRRQFGIKKGAKFYLSAKNDTIILKNVTTPSFNDLDRILSTLRKEAKGLRMKKSDIDKAVADVRSK